MDILNIDTFGKRIISLINFGKKNAFLVYLIIFIISFMIGILNTKIQINEVQLNNIAISNTVFFKILLNNLLVGTALLFGFLFFNVYNLATVSINGFLFGFYLNKCFSSIGVLNTMLIFIPHGILEAYWIILISTYSTTLSRPFMDFLKSDFDDHTIFKRIFSLETLKIYCIIFITAMIENYFTTSLFNLLNKQ